MVNIKQPVKGRQVDAPVLEQMFRERIARKKLNPLKPQNRCKFNNLVSCNTICGPEIKAPPIWCKRWNKHHKYFKRR